MLSHISIMIVDTKQVQVTNFNINEATTNPKLQNLNSKPKKIDLSKIQNPKRILAV